MKFNRRKAKMNIKSKWVETDEGIPEAETKG